MRKPSASSVVVVAPPSLNMAAAGLRIVDVLLELVLIKMELRPPNLLSHFDWLFSSFLISKLAALREKRTAVVGASKKSLWSIGDFERGLD